MAGYPDWVLAHKKKGTYINRVGDKYYLYAAHSERIPGTNKVRRVSDGYLGRITEADGFVPAKRKLSDSVFVYEYGLSETVFRLCKQIHTDLKRKFKANADSVMASGVLVFMYGRAAPEFYETSGISLRLPGLDMAAPLTDWQNSSADSTARMITYRMKTYFGDDFGAAMELLPLIRAAIMAGDRRLAVIPAAAAAFCRKHDLDFEEGK
jgi:uncharacterized membrane protein